MDKTLAKIQEYEAHAHTRLRSRADTGTLFKLSILKEGVTIVNNRVHGDASSFLLAS
jgi:hypothetical protein